MSPVPIRPPVNPELNPDAENELFIGLLTIEKDSSLFLWTPDFSCYFSFETANEELGFGMLGLLVYSGVFF